MTTSRTPSSPLPSRSSTRRRAAVIAAASLVLVPATWTLAGPSSALVPEGWDTPDSVNPLHFFLVVAGLPLGLFVVITAVIYLPAMIRGERVAPGAPTVEDQWLGGPRKSAGELAAPDSETSQAGGASARW